MVKYLSEQEQHVLKLRFDLMEMRDILAEIGRLEVSRERVRQVELKALRKLEFNQKITQRYF